MKPTVISAANPTPQSIVRYFQISHKRHLFLTGSRHSGKTTLFRALLPLLSGQISAPRGSAETSAPHLSVPQRIPGLTSWAEPGKCVCLRNNETGETAVIGRCRDNPARREEENASGRSVSCPPGLQMTPVEEGFLQTGIPALEHMIVSDCPLVSIDEIGYLESGCAAYCEMLERLLDCKSVLAVLRKQDTPLLRKLSSRSDVFLYDLDTPLPALGCILMASGEGRRFGGNKLLAPFQGKPLIEWALSAADTNLFTDRIVVTRHPEIAELCRRRSIRFLLHDLPWRSDTIRLGLETLTKDRPLSGCMFCPCDQPLLTGETVEAMAAAFIGQPDAVWQLASEDSAGSPVIFPKSCFEALKHLPQGKGGSYLLRKEHISGSDKPDQSQRPCSIEKSDTVEEKTPAPVRRLEAASAWELKDIDTREDLEMLEDLHLSALPPAPASEVTS